MPKFNWNKALGGAGSGALSGAAVGGGIGGPVGAAVGAVGGGILGLFSGVGGGKDKLSAFDKRQKKLYKEYAKSLTGEGQFADMYNFDEQAARDRFQKNYAEPAYENFNENIVPTITGQFRGRNLQNSSYAAGALSKAGRDVQRNLDTQMTNYLYQGEQDALKRRLDSLRDILGMETFAYQKPQGSPFGEAVNQFAGSAGKYGADQFWKWLESRNAGTQGTVSPVPATS